LVFTVFSRVYLLPILIKNFFFDAEGLKVFKDLLQGNSLKSSLLILEKEYDNAINSKGELDERMFANDEDSLLGSGSLSGGAINLPGTKVLLASKIKIHPLLHYLKAQSFEICLNIFVFRAISEEV